MGSGPGRARAAAGGGYTLPSRGARLAGGAPYAPGSLGKLRTLTVTDAEQRPGPAGQAELLTGLWLCPHAGRPPSHGPVDTGSLRNTGRHWGPPGAPSCPGRCPPPTSTSSRPTPGHGHPPITPAETPLQPPCSPRTHLLRGHHLHRHAGQRRGRLSPAPGTCPRGVIPWPAPWSGGPRPHHRLTAGVLPPRPGDPHPHHGSLGAPSERPQPHCPAASC